MVETWRERVIRARARGGFVRADRERAARWSTCAVGKLARCYPEAVRLRNGRPVDEDLGRLGAVFFAAILAGDVGRAEATLDAIDDRVLELKRHAGAPPARPSTSAGPSPIR